MSAECVSSDSFRVDDGCLLFMPLCRHGDARFVRAFPLALHFRGSFSGMILSLAGVCDRKIQTTAFQRDSIVNANQEEQNLRVVCNVHSLQYLL